ncbi:MAG TPA: hypothetical protein ENK25_02135 [Bacteroidetes bacterium]|nr:hypothetical protein [Bacteroidota bacterium]
MDTLLEILKYTLPALIVFLAVYFVLREMVRSQDKEHKMEIILENQRLITPVKLQAYERLILFLERISLESLIMRVNRPGMTTQQLHREMLQAIRSEYEHNLSQQLYISPNAWEVIKNARANMLKIINTMYEKFKPDAPALEYSKSLMEELMEMEKQPTQAAIEFLKAEVNRIF